MLDNAAVEKEKRVKTLKRKMEPWREIVLPLNSIMQWEKPWYPGLIFGATTTIFFMIWILEPAILTLISISLLLFTGIDYLVPIVTSKFFASEKWSGQQEKKLDEICHGLIGLTCKIKGTWNWVLNARNTWPNVYYASLISFLVFLAWLGSAINNLFLIYIMVNIVLLAPGLKHTKHCEMAIQSFYRYAMHAKKA